MTSESTNGAASKARKRIAIVGGGPSALVAAFHLTRNEPEAYEITIYEMSWRLGGKTVSGRGEHHRIEEHGLHILFGCYHNVFATMLECYDEMSDEELVDRSEHWMQHFYDAIEPHHFGVIGDDRPERWAPILIEFPSNRGVPGDAPLPSLFDLLSTLFQLSWMVLISARSLRLLHKMLGPVFDFKNRWTAADFEKRVRGTQQRHERDSRNLGGSVWSRGLLRVAKSMLDRNTFAGRASLGALKLAQRMHAPLGRVAPGVLGRWWSAADFMQAVLRGLIEYDVLSKPGGFEDLDEHDLRGWLSQCGAAEETLASPWMRVIYDAAFSYPKGGLEPREDQLKPGECKGELVGAGAALRALMLMTLTFKGAFYNKMRAGMGDVIHVPLYLVLQNRNVKFRFFHRLTDMKAEAGPGGHRITSLKFDTLPHDAPLDYDPLIDARGLRCWPSEPNVKGLTADSVARARAAESYGPTDAPSREVEIKLGDDFDAVLLGTPVACLPYVCPTLLQQDRENYPAPPAGAVPVPRLYNQHQIDTVQTIALQLWLKPNLSRLGFRDPPPLLSLFRDPMNTWCDMTHLEPCEDWPENLRAGNVSYFCGALPHENEFPAPGELARLPAVRTAIEAQMRAVNKDFVERKLYELLPTVRSADGFNYGLLVDPNNGKDEARMRAAYQRVNYEPHALCTLALPGKTGYRMRADETGYSNLFVTGDWIANGVYLACVEGAFQSGIRSARAISAHYGGAVDRYVIMAEGLLNLPVTKPTAPPPTELRAEHRRQVRKPAGAR